MIYDTEANAPLLDQLNADSADGTAREAALKRENSRWIATEEVLDKWHAQSVGVSAQDYLEKKRAHQRLTRGHADKVQVQAQQKAEKILK